MCDQILSCMVAGMANAVRNESKNQSSIFVSHT
jgi:hypothetical protein